MLVPDGTGVSESTVNGHQSVPRAEEAGDLLTAVQHLITAFIQKADDNAESRSRGQHPNPPTSEPRSTLVEPHPPRELQNLLQFALPEHGLGRSGFIDMVEKIFRYSVNVWDQGFLDKLYATTTPVGLAADLVLSSLNTNVHVYQVSPALTVIEKETGRALAARFGLDGPHAGGITQPGGSAANQTSMVIARNHLFPDTKTHGNGARRLVLFTSAHGHYSVEKAAQMFGLGTQAVRAIAVDARGRMQPAALDRAIVEARAAGETPFYVNATAGTTVLGSFDPVDRIADVARRHGLWLHVDASWGGSVVFSDAQKGKLRGADRADSISICPHKMLNVPLTCSFLLGRDLRTFHRGMTLPAGYLFHGDNPEDDDDDDDDDDEEEEKNDDDDENPSSSSSSSSSSTTAQFWDLADLTPQCGRRGDSLKLALVWLHHGRAGLGSQIDAAFAAAALLADLLVRDPAHFTLVSAEVPPPCLQVCFYYRKRDPEGDGDGAKAAARRNGVVTRRVCRALVARGFMVDYAPGVEGLFLRVVVNGFTEEGTVRGLVGAVREVGEELGL